MGRPKRADKSAGLMAEKDIMAGKNIGLIISYGNIDQQDAARILSGEMPN